MKLSKEEKDLLYQAVEWYLDSDIRDTELSQEDVNTLNDLWLKLR